MSKTSEVEKVESPGVAPTVALTAMAAGLDWTKAKQLLDYAVKFDQCKVWAQVMLGFELAALKKQLGVVNGKKTELSQDGKGWVSLLEEHLDIAHTTAYRFMEMAKAAAKRLKKLPGLKELPLLDQPLGELTGPQQEALRKGVAKLTDGKTQLEFMYEQGIAKKPQGSGAKGGGKGGKALKDLSAEEQAALLKEQAAEQWAEIVLLLNAYAEKFALLEDVAGQAQLSLLETHVKARHAWLGSPKDKRDLKAVAKILGA